MIGLLGMEVVGIATFFASARRAWRMIRPSVRDCIKHGGGHTTGSSYSRQGARRGRSQFYA